jgi:cytidylate kinase
MSRSFHIAIDGPVSAGKGTISRLVAQRLGFLYVDTGAMYRTTALLALQNEIPFDDEEKLVALLKQSSMQMRNPNEEEKDGRLTTVFLNDEDVSWKIRTEDVSSGSSQVAVLPKVREILVEKQQQIAQGQDVIMEGRDITYRVLPNAELKIYLTGSDVVRAKRRMMQLQTKGQDVSFDEVYEELAIRDQRDMSRATDPLKKVDDAWEIDTSDLSIEQVVDLIVAKVHVLQNTSSPA